MPLWMPLRVPLVTLQERMVKFNKGEMRRKK